MPKASTADVLSPVTFKVPGRYQQAYARLIKLRDVLMSRQERLTRDAAEESPSFSTHMADAGTDEFDRDLALSLVSSRQDSLYQIEQALDRIRNGSYGICEMTGKPIEPQRLEAIPWTRFTAAAERQLEREGIPRLRQRLNPRDSVQREQPETAEAED